jgi:hypothetical protein
MDGPRIVIDGREYAFPTFDTLTMDDSIAIEDYTGMTLEVFGQRLTTGGAGAREMAAVVHIALSRDPAYANTPYTQLRKQVGQIQLDKFDLKGFSEDASPPATAQNGNAAAPPPSGLTSDEPSVETPAATPLTTGVPI